jgi:hypothetical protein
MAKIVLGIGTSHSPQLSVPGDLWDTYAERDKRNPGLYRIPDGKHVTYEELLDEPHPGIEKQLTSEVFQARHEANQAGISKLAEVMEKANPDVIVMFGDDQSEVFSADFMPAMCVFWGDTVPFSRRSFGNRDAAMEAIDGYYSRPEKEYPVHAKLGKHIIESLSTDDFDIMHARTIGEGKSISHAFGFVWNRLMGDKITQTVPIHINTYFSPNQPTPLRSWELGQSVRKAVESWDNDLRVAVLGSGGFSHFVVDEEIDQNCIKALEGKNTKAIGALPLERLQSGTSEVRNWFAAAGAAEELDMHMVDYVPCYRSVAGTGCAMGFAYWS